MRECRSCGMDVEPVDGACPNCGTVLDGSTESFRAVMPGGDIPADAAGPEPALLVQNGPEEGERFTLDRESLTVGRDPASDIFLNDVTVSRRHAKLSRIGAEVSVADAGSLNGTYVNGIRVDDAQLNHGDMIQVGRFQMVFLAGGAA